MEKHRIHRVGWLRAAVLGANDGIISIASLLIGVAAANTAYHGTLIAGIAGLIAGALSMAAGEYVSVSSQADTEKAELALEKKEIETNFSAETQELTNIYIKRGLDSALAQRVAAQLMATDPLAAHARDELGITENLSARPLQAAIFSAISFSIGGILPVVTLICAPYQQSITWLWISSLFCLILLGLTAAKVGGSKLIAGATRVLLWGSLAMLISASIGKLLGVSI